MTSQLPTKEMVEAAQDVTRLAMFVCKHMPSDSDEDNFSEYCDDKILIHWEHGIKITLSSGETVLETSTAVGANGIQLYRAGRWVCYVRDLAKEAERLEMRRQQDWEREVERRLLKAFSPIDDSALFPDPAKVA